MIDKAHEIVLEQGRTCAHAWLCACMHKGVSEGMYVSVGARCRSRTLPYNGSWRECTLVRGTLIPRRGMYVQGELAGMHTGQRHLGKP
eukprot:350803-Chlamydomonas_euryale.AAC.1